MTTTTTAIAKTEAATVATTKAPAADPFVDMIRRQESEIKTLSDGVMTADMVLSLMLLAARKTPEILLCTAASIVNAVRDSARLGLTPDGIQGAMIVYNDRKNNRKELQFQPMYRGLLHLGYSRGVVKEFDARIVFDVDEFEVEYNMAGDRFVHRPNFKATGKRTPVAYYAIARLVNGGVLHRIMTADEMGAHERKYSRDFGPWKDHPEEMRLKTVIKKLYKRLPADIKMREALMIDDAQYLDAEVETKTEPKKRGAALLEEVGAKKALPPASEPAPPVVETQQKPPQSTPPSAPVVAPPPPADGQDEAPWTDDGGQPTEAPTEAPPDEPAPAEDHQAQATAPVPDATAPIVEAPRPLPATVEADYATFVEAITTMPHDPDVTSAMSKHVGKYKARFSPGQYEAMTMLGKGVVNVGAKKLPAVDGMRPEQLASLARGLAVTPNPLTRLVNADPTTSILAFEGMAPEAAVLLRAGLEPEGDGAANAG